MIYIYILIIILHIVISLIPLLIFIIHTYKNVITAPTATELTIAELTTITIELNHLSQLQVDEIQKTKWSCKDGVNTCTVCIEDFDIGDEVKTLPCKHVFHSLCINKWVLERSTVCPNCKRLIVRESS